MDKIKVYVVDGVRYNVGPNREQEFLQKFPNAAFVEEVEREGKEKAVANQGASVTAQAAPTTELQPEISSSELAYEVPEKLKRTNEEKEAARQRYIEEANAGPYEEFQNMSFAEYRKSGLMKPEDEKFYTGSGTKRVKVTKNVIDPFMDKARKELNTDDENLVIEKAKALYVENKLEEDKYKKVEDYLRDEAGILDDDLRTFRGIQAESIENLQKDIESDLKANYDSFTKLNTELKNVIAKAQSIKDAEYTSEEERLKAKDEFVDLRETANILAKAASKRHEAIMSSSKTYADNAKFLDIYKREYSDAMVLIGGATATSSELIGGLLKLPEWLTVSVAQAFDKGKDARTLWNMYSKFSPVSGASNELLDFGEKVRGQVARPPDISEINSFSDASAWSSDLVGNQLPILAALAASGGAGLAVISASAAGKKYEDMAKEIDSGLEDYNAAQLLFAPLAVAAGEAISEGFSTLPQIKAVKQVFKKSPDILKASKDYIANNILKPQYLKDVATESLGEGFATLNENVVDIFLLDKQKNIWEGVPNALASGAFMSGVMFKAPAIGARLIAPYTDMERLAGQLNNNIKQIDNINEALQREDLDDDVKQSLRKNLDTLFKNNIEILSQTAADIDGLTEAERETLEIVNFEIESVEAQARLIMRTNPEQIAREMLAGEITDNYNNLKKQRRQILFEARQRNLDKEALGEDGIKKEIEKDAERLEKLGKQIGFTTKVFQDSSEALSWLEKNSPVKDRAKLVKYALGSYGFFDPNTNMAFIIKDANLADSIMTTGLHEGFHALLRNTTRKNPRFVTDVGSKLHQFLQQNVVMYQDTEFSRRLNSYQQDFRRGEITASTYIEEVFPLLSEALKNGDIQYKETAFTKLGDLFRRFFQSMGLRIKFESGRDVFNFVRDYNKSFEKGKLTRAQRNFAMGSSKLTEKDLAPVIEEEIRQSKIEPKENDRLANLLAENQNKFLTDPALDKLIGGVANSVTKRYWDPIPAELRAGFTRDEYFNTVSSNLLMTALKWKPEKQDIGKYLANMGFLTNKTLARDEFGIEQSIEEGGAGFMADFETSREAQMMTSEGVDIVDETKVVKRDKLKDKLPLDHKYDGVTIEDIAKEKLGRAVTIATKTINNQRSNNKQVSDFVKEVGKEMSFELKDAIVSMMTNYPGGLPKFLTDNKALILDNLGTDYMLKHGLFKKAIQKSYGAKNVTDRQGRLTKEPNWVSAVKVAPNTYEFLDARNQKIDSRKFDRRSGVKADGSPSITSGLIFRRRHPDRNKIVTNEEIVQYYYRDKKLQFEYSEGIEALAKQIAKEYSFEILSEDLKSNGPMFQRLKEVADILNLALASTINEQLVKDIERGDIKLSNRTANLIQTDDLSRNMYDILMTDMAAKDGNLGYLVQQSIYPEITGEDAVELYNVIKQSKKENTPADVNKLPEQSIERLDAMLFEKKGISMEEMSDHAAQIAINLQGRKARLRYVPPKFDDFWGLMYYMVRKGKTGDADIQWIQDNIMEPYTRGHVAYVSYRQGILKNYDEIYKRLRKSKDVKLDDTNESGLKNEDSVRLLLWSRLRDENGAPIPMPANITKDEVQKAVKYARQNKTLSNFATQLQYLFPEGYPVPTEDWMSKSISLDIIEHLNEKSRKDFMSEFIAKSEEAFGTVDQMGKLKGSFANKLRVAFGKEYVDSLGDMLQRMKAGRARRFGQDSDARGIMNWVNNATGAVMFLNVRSAALQMVSVGNYLNMGDNNVFAATAALANTPQYAADVLELINSDYLKARRGGTQLDIRAEEIATLASSPGRLTPGKVLAKLLQKGFVLTSGADSLAIGLGGATLYRNRINTYLKEGKSEADAKAAAFQDFVEATEESQQSSRQDRLSKVQMGPLGRIVFAFGNTPMQYSRITKKAALDLANGRGNQLSNISRLMYYGALQNVIFSTLQNALFYALFDDEEKDDVKLSKALQTTNSIVDTVMRASGWWGLGISTVKNIGLEAYRQSQKDRPDLSEATDRVLSISPPIGSKFNKIKKGFREIEYNGGFEAIGKEGFSWDNPVWKASAYWVEGATNFPAGRAIEKIDNLMLMTEDNIDTTQKVMLGLGYKPYQLNIDNRKKKKSGKSKLKRSKL